MSWVRIKVFGGTQNDKRRMLRAFPPKLLSLRLQQFLFRPSGHDHPTPMSFSINHFRIKSNFHWFEPQRPPQPAFVFIFIRLSVKCQLDFDRSPFLTSVYPLSCGVRTCTSLSVCVLLTNWLHNTHTCNERAHTNTHTLACTLCTEWCEFRQSYRSCTKSELDEFTLSRKVALE